MADVPLITFDQAQAIGEKLYDRWIKMIGAAPLERDDLGWGDIVQFVVREARAAAIEKERADDA
jgi:hypothetical protein